MKDIMILVLLSTTSVLYSQSGVVHSRSVEAQNLTRSYLLYVPAAYDGQEPWPLVINYHGHQSNATNQMEIHSKMNVIADSAHFLVAYPQGLNVLAPGFGTAPGWNAPGLQAAQDDVDFTDSLLYNIKKDFNVDPSRVHATGWSNGSMFSFWLAFKRSDAFASVAGVSGPLTFSMLDSLAANRPISTLFMHGTNDPVVNFNGIPNLTVPAPETAAFWVDQNNCSGDTIVTELPDVYPNDGSTVTRIQYTGCDDNTEVLFYRIEGGGHGWPGESPSLPQIGDTNNDMNASSEIWNFFKRNPHPEITTGIAANSKNSPSTFRVYQNYPNPFNPTTTIEFSLPQSGFVTLKVYNLLGEEVATLLEAHQLAGRHTVNFDASTLASGLYCYTLTAGDPSTGSGQAFKQSRKMLLLR